MEKKPTQHLDLLIYLSNHLIDQRADTVDWDVVKNRAGFPSEDSAFLYTSLDDGLNIGSELDVVLIWLNDEEIDRVIGMKDIPVAFL